MPLHLNGLTLLAGHAQGELVYSDTGLSFWGGVNPSDGTIIDRHHPLYTQSIKGKILAIPGARGSCTGSSVMLELLLSGNAPAALVTIGKDDILLLGVIVAKVMFGVSIPLVSVDAASFAQLKQHQQLSLYAQASADLDHPSNTAQQACLVASTAALPSFELSAADQDCLAGKQGQAMQVAMQIIVALAKLDGAKRLLDITQVHVDGCIYTGDACLQFAQKLVSWGAKVRVPTTLNAISVDRCNWRSQGIPPTLGEPAEALAQAYVEMGATPSYTCAPYYLDSAPKLGEQIAWGESNAVVFANSVLGARTAKYPDFLDILMAITGRAPEASCHLDHERLARVQVNVTLPAAYDEALYPLLGYLIGLQVERHIPVITGLEQAQPSIDDLRAFGAAFATTSGAPMFHIVGATPEATSLEQALGGLAPLEQKDIAQPQLIEAWQSLSAAKANTVELVALGNPHFSAQEITTLAQLCTGRNKSPQVALIITTSRSTLNNPDISSAIKALREFGTQFVVDACWCMLDEPLIPPHAQTIMTNSGKYAHYAPGLVGRATRFGSLQDCVDAACTGQVLARLPSWLVAS